MTLKKARSRRPGSAGDLISGPRGRHPAPMASGTKKQISRTATARMNHLAGRRRSASNSCNFSRQIQLRGAGLSAKRRNPERFQYSTTNHTNHTNTRERRDRTGVRKRFPFLSYFLFYSCDSWLKNGKNVQGRRRSMAEPERQQKSEPSDTPQPTPNSVGVQRQMEIYQAGLKGRQPRQPVAVEKLERKARAVLRPEAYLYVAGG